MKLIMSCSFFLFHNYKFWLQSRFNWASRQVSKEFTPQPPLVGSHFLLILSSLLLNMALSIYRCELLLLLLTLLVLPFDILCHISFSQIMMLKMKIIGTHWWNLIRWEKLNLRTVTVLAPSTIPSCTSSTTRHGWPSCESAEEWKNNNSSKKWKYIFVVSHQISN